MNIFDGQLQAVAGHQHVRRLDVAVDHALAVKIGQCINEGNEHFARFVRRERPLGQHLRERLVGIFRDDIEEFYAADRGASALKYAHEVRMRKLRGRSPVAQAFFGILRIRGHEPDHGSLRLRSFEFCTENAGLLRIA